MMDSSIVDLANIAFAFRLLSASAKAKGDEALAHRYERYFEDVYRIAKREGCPRSFDRELKMIEREVFG